MLFHSALEVSKRDCLLILKEDERPPVVMIGGTIPKNRIEWTHNNVEEPTPPAG